MKILENQESAPKFFCKFCDYYTSRKCNYDFEKNERIIKNVLKEVVVDKNI